ncbi:hypothetical protein HDZ31DRAFT_35852 [Schizophyllum fasciatum]
MRTVHLNGPTWSSGIEGMSQNQSAFKEFGRQSQGHVPVAPKAEYNEPALFADDQYHDTLSVYRQGLTSPRIPDYGSCPSSWSGDGGIHSYYSRGEWFDWSIGPGLTMHVDGTHEEAGVSPCEPRYQYVCVEPMGGRKHSPATTAPSRNAPSSCDQALSPPRGASLHGPHGSANGVSDGRMQGGGAHGPPPRNPFLAQYSTIADALTPVAPDNRAHARPPAAQIAGLPDVDECKPFDVGTASDAARAGDATKRKTASPKRHMCTVCQKCFPRPGGLQTHMNAHNNVKPYPCGHPSCTMCFSVQSNARRHRRNAHGVPFAEEYEDRQRHLPTPQPDITFDRPVVNEQGSLAVPQHLLWMPLNDSGSGSSRSA